MSMRPIPWRLPISFRYWNSSSGRSRTVPSSRFSTRVGMPSLNVRAMRPGVSGARSGGVVREYTSSPATCSGSSSTPASCEMWSRLSSSLNGLALVAVTSIPCCSANASSSCRPLKCARNSGSFHGASTLIVGCSA